MDIYTGTSGFSYKEWKGPFYPEKLAATKMLGYYAEQLRTVEINNTFYRMPNKELMTKWAAQVPDGFRFVIKASQRITHWARLAGAEEPLAYLWETVGELGPHLGPVLFQLPPNFKADVPRLEAFLSGLPDGMRPAFEFRHESWRDEAVHEALRAGSAALCIADKDDEDDPDVVATTDWGYFRLRRSTYTDEQLAIWADRIRAQPWREVYVFFKHEDEGFAPKMAQQFARLLGE